MAEQPTILFVDDEPGIADGHATRLADEYETLTANDGETALEVVDDGVDVVFLDRRMPGMGGEAVLEAIREAGHDCRVVMLTGVEPDADVVEMGFDDYLVKPVDAEDLRETAERLSHPPPEGIDDDVLDALGDAKTRRCCYVLLDGPCSAREVADATGYSLPTVYRRLNALTQADLIEERTTVDPDGGHYKSFAAVPTRIDIEIGDRVRMAVDRAEADAADGSRV